jgi:uncharacterized membrane protein YhaH (DUF805 family)
METIEKTKKCPFCGEEILTVAQKCKHCGEWLTEQTPQKTKVCPFCAEEIDESCVVCPECKASLVEQAVSENIPKPTTVHNKNSDNEAASGWFMNYFVHVIRFQYADFKGTATRKEYWIYALLSYLLLLVSIGIGVLFANIVFLIFLCIFLALLVPSLAIAVRRLHDTDKSGWWLLIDFIPIVGTIWLIVLLCQKGKTANKKVSFATSDIIIIVAIVASILLPLGAYTYASFSEDNNESVASQVQSNEIETTQPQPVDNNNLITRTSIADIEIIGKTPKEVKPYFNDALTWEYIEGEESQPEGYWIKNGEYTVFQLYLRNRKISAMRIYATDLATADGLRVGSTAGDLLKLYPNATVRDAEFGEYTEINGILYIFDSDWDKTVGDYSNSEYSSIVNRGIQIRAILIGSI